MKTPVFIVAILCLVSTVRAQNGAAGVQPSGATFFAVQVPDADSAATWYGAAFDLEVANRIEADDGRYSIRILTRPGLTVEIVRQRGVSAAAADPVLGLFKAGIYVADLDAAVRGLGEHGVPTDRGFFTDRVLDVRTFVFRDPWGNRIQLFEPCEGPCPEDG